MYVCMYVCISAPRFIQFVLGSCYAVHTNALSIIIIKVYIESNNIHVELIRFSKKISTLFTFTFAKLGIRPHRRGVYAARSMDLCVR